MIEGCNICHVQIKIRLTSWMHKWKQTYIDPFNSEQGSQPHPNHSQSNKAQMSQCVDLRLPCAQTHWDREGGRLNLAFDFIRSCWVCITEHFIYIPAQTGQVSVCICENNNQQLVSALLSCVLLAPYIFGVPLKMTSCCFLLHCCSCLTHHGS